MRRLLVAVFLTVFAAPALAQGVSSTPGMGIPMNQEKEVSPEVRAKRQATEEAYKSTMKSIPNAKPASTDPWGNMRGTSDNAPKAKAPAKKSAGNPAN
jgi:hypothetical protein